MASFSEVERMLEVYFKELADSGRRIEILRELLSRQADFDPLLLFAHLSNNKDKLSTYNLISFAIRNHLDIEENDVLEVMISYSIKAEGELSYVEFLNLILPVKDIVLRRLAIAKNLKHKSSKEIPLNINAAFRKLILEEVSTLKKLKPLKLELTKCSGYKIYKLFELVVEPKCNFITKYGLKSFMKNKFTLDADITQIIQRLDKDKDGKVSYLDFLSNLSLSQLDIRHHSMKSVNDHKAAKIITSIGIQTEDNELPLFSIKKKRSESKKMDTLIQEDMFVTPERIALGSPEYPTTGDTPGSATNIAQRQQELLEKFFKDGLEIDKQTEELKEDLCKRPDYNIENVFILFSKGKRDTISLYELKATLKELTIEKPYIALLNLMKRYDLDRDGVLNYNEFKQILIPINTKPTNKNTNMTEDTLQQFKRLLIALIDNEVNIEKIRRDINAQIMNLLERFKNSTKDGLTIKELKELMNKSGNRIEHIEAELIMQRYDKDRDGRISNTEFIREVTPILDID